MVKGGLRLKREIAQPRPTAPSGPFTVAQLWVDAGVYHLDSLFSYLIPGNLAEKISIGSLVAVDFHGRTVSAVVALLENPESTNGLKSISKLLGDIPPLSGELIELIRAASERYAAHPFDIIRSAIPDRVVTVEREFVGTEVSTEQSATTSVREYLQLPPSRDRYALLAEKAAQLSKSGSVLVIAPDHVGVSAIHEALLALDINALAITSQTPRSDKYRNFLKARVGAVDVIVGTRSAIFTPLHKLQSILIYNEGSEHYYEQRSPGWNVRDIALMRSGITSCNLYLAGFAPSAETARLIDQGWISYKRIKAKVKVSQYQQSHGELLPSRAIAPIKAALARGTVLFLVPRKGFAQAIRCAACKTISRCACGGAHEKKSATAAITCSHCLTVASPWQCVWCHGQSPALQSRGIERHQQELGHLFPGVASYMVSADHPLTSEISRGFVLATVGSAPIRPDGYQAVVILEGNRFQSESDLRAQERARDIYFSHASLLAPGGTLIAIQDDGDPLMTALTTWNPSPVIHRELQERQQLNLPPYVRSVVMAMDTGEITRLKNALLSAREEGRLPDSVKIHGPIPRADKSALIITVEIADGEELIVSLHEFMRRRSAAKKALPSLRIDPYSLSH